ncbi:MULTISPECIES: ATP-dependent RNA helicase DbpA [unclassified Oceanispirochaeta]|uniref:ATP-dependent RNA helicase DbpA n=1 Tax=unclassified Oceanispirochaeta TaxID=2635722 RepID=UPI000E091AE8|nr:MULTISPECIES: ATP-dependent RNA helicase DbpA [unclassified Oceanispirochaeta]MBF9016019.1 ATP-dependent RNA helicase DbpA [Oceanispirochaeta sp. M2]NPD72482.1 ATP-dependent RNA helicase DbpA [Oceanispirochaeta sp. M1]RDG31941.1 ATP-dependent RNA helicase DbpA [Oceanispirochaeta sp. M1]
MNAFNTLPLSRALLDTIKDLNYEVMTPIQEQSIPPILEGKDVLAQAKTGSGKTAAFGIGLLENMDTRRYRVQSLILCPTRELAEQVSDELRRLARFQHNIKLVKITGGFPMHKQEHSLSHQAHIVVGTPGRVQKLLHRGSLILDELKTLVLDEADRMLDMGFIDQINDIIGFAPPERQTLCFSATFPDDIRALSLSVMNNPVEVTVESQHKDTVIEQHFYEMTPQVRGEGIISILDKHRPESCLIFCNTKDACRRVEEELKNAGLHCLAIHGDLEQKERTEVLIRFSNGSSRILVATDVAARGLDISELGAVINYDLPFETETYVHRIGRTGRAGSEGLAFSLMRSKEMYRLELINEFTKSHYQPERLDFTELKDPSALAAEMVTLSINGGRRNKISPGDILGALTVKDGIPGTEVGKIDRLDYITFVAVRRDSAERAFKILDNGTIKGRSFRAMNHEV